VRVLVGWPESASLSAAEVGSTMPPVWRNQTHRSCL